MIFRRISIVAAAMLLVAGIVMMKKLAGSEKEAAVETPSLLKSVETVTVSVADRSVEERFTGRVFSAARAQMVAEVAGRLLPTEREVKEGVSFAEGEVMFRIDDTELRMAVIAQRSQLLTAIAQLLPDLSADHPVAAAQWRGYLDGADAASPLPDLPASDDAKLKRFLTSRGIPAQFYSIRSQEAKLAKYVLRAPFAGTVSRGSSLPGSQAMPGQFLAEVIDPDRLELETVIPASAAASVRAGQRLMVMHDGDTITATVQRVSSRVDDRTQNVALFAQLGHRSGLRDGEAVSGMILLPKVAGATLLHRRQLMNGSMVVAVTQDSLLTMIPVSTEAFQGDSVIVSGLPDGLLILDRPFIGAHEGMKVWPKIRLAE